MKKLLILFLCTGCSLTITITPLKKEVASAHPISFNNPESNTALTWHGFTVDSSLTIGERPAYTLTPWQPGIIDTIDSLKWNTIHIDSIKLR
jgi:hypothetical protein